VKTEECQITCLIIDSDDDYIGAGLKSGQITLYKRELLFGEFCLKKFRHHTKQINDIVFIKREHISLFIAIGSDTLLSVTSLDEMTLIFKLDLGKYPLRNVSLINGRDQILVSTFVEKKMFKIYFNWFDIPKKNRDN